MTWKLDLRYPGFRYQGEVAVQADHMIAIDSPALAEALAKKLIPVGPSSRTDASNIEISTFFIDDSGRVILTSPDLYALLENASCNIASSTLGDIGSGIDFINDYCSPQNDLCSSIYNGTCVGIQNSGCS